MEENNELFKPQELFVENEEKYISYLLNGNSFDCIDFNEKFFLNADLKTVFISIKKLELDKIKIEKDILYDSIQQITKDISKEYLELLTKKYNDFENISIVKKRIKENFLKQNSTKTILHDILLQTTNSGDLDLSKIDKYKEELSDTLLEINDDSFDLMSFEEVIENKYRNLLSDRNEGVGKRTLGFSWLDKNLTYPGEPGDITTIAMRKGEGKTVLALNIANALLGVNVPVVYFCLDMGYVTVMDRLLCIRGALSNSDILQEDKEEKLIKKIDSELSRLLKIKHFLIYPEGSISLKDFESYVLKVKKIFRQNGVFKNDDEYFVCLFDTIDMVEDFSGADPYKIKASINKQSTVLKKYGIHAINLNQLNENQVRAKKPTTLEAVDYLKYTKEDIEGGSSYASRSRTVIIGTRPKAMKKSFFPEEEELIALDDDEMRLIIDKQNDGRTGRIYPNLIFDENTFRLYKQG